MCHRFSVSLIGCIRERYQVSKDQHDVLKHYDGPWPVVAYMSRYLADRIPQLKAGKIGLSTRSGPRSGTSCASVRVDLYKHGEGRRRAPATASHRSLSAAALTGQLTAAPPPTSSDDHGNGYDAPELHEFLGALKPDLSHLLPDFFALGIIDKRMLSGLRAWPSMPRTQFLAHYLSGKVTALELAAFELGLTGCIGCGLDSVTPDQ